MFDVCCFIYGPRITYYSKLVFYVDFCSLQIDEITHLRSERDNSCGSTRPFAHGKMRVYPWEVCVLCVTSIPTVKLPVGNHYIKKNKRTTHDISRTKS